MSKNRHISNLRYGNLPVEDEGFNDFIELALDMRWSWNHEADVLKS